MKIFKSWNANSTWAVQTIYYCLCDPCLRALNHSPEVTELSPLVTSCTRENLIIREQDKD